MRTLAVLCCVLAIYTGLLAFAAWGHVLSGRVLLVLAVVWIFGAGFFSTEDLRGDRP